MSRLLPQILMNEAGDGEAGAPASAMGAAASAEPAAAPADDPGAAAEVVAEGWLKGVPAEYANEKIMQAVPDVQTLVKNYVHAQRMVGKDKVIIPDQNATDEERKAFYHKIGLPVEDQYKLAAKEGGLLAEDFVKDFQQLAYQNNILPAQAEALMNFYEEKMAAEDSALSAESKTKSDESLAALRTEWGEGYDKNMARAVEVVNNFGADVDLMAHLDVTGLGNDTKLIKFLANIGAQLNEDTFKGEAIAHMGLTKDEAQSKINTMYADPKGAYLNDQHPNHAQTVKEMYKLQEAIAK